MYVLMVSLLCHNKFTQCNHFLQQRPYHGHMTYHHPDPLFPPRDVPFHSYPIEPQLTQSGYYDNRHFQASNPYLSQVNFPYWRDRSPEKVPPRQELWPQAHPYVHGREEPHPFHGPLLETCDLPPLRMLGGVQRPGDVGMTMTKIVPAETIFDMPGRTERPSHVRNICTPICLYMYTNMLAFVIR